MRKLIANTLIVPSAARLLAAFVAILLLASCASTPDSTPAPVMIEKDSAGKAIDTSVIPNAKPKPEPITKAGNKSPYEVFGKTYKVMPTNKNYSATGIASWYGTKFHGRLTSNGEIYNMYGMTAAHKTLPIPSYVKVTNVENGRSIVVRVNDRGPFHGDRIIDLSYVAAMKLGYVDKGTAKVLVEAIDTDPKAPEPPLVTATPSIVAAGLPQSAPVTASYEGQYLQVGAFSDASLADQLRGKIGSLVSYPMTVRNQNNLFKLWIGPIANHLELHSIQEMLKTTANLSAFAVSP